MTIKVIMGSDYEGYDMALEDCSLQKLSQRRDEKCLIFGLRSLKHHKLKSMFPLTKKKSYKLRNEDKFVVNKSRTQSYADTSIPYIQRKLNDFFRNTT